MSLKNESKYELTDEVKSRIEYVLKTKYSKSITSFEKKFLDFLNGEGPSPLTSMGIQWVKYARSLEIYRKAFPCNPRTGLERCGLDQKGFDANGLHFETRSTYDDNGLDKNGLDIDGYDRDGYDLDGFNKNGYNRNGEKGMAYKERKKEEKRKGLLKHYDSKMDEKEVEAPQPYGGIYSTTDGQ